MKLLAQKSLVSLCFFCVLLMCITCFPVWSEPLIANDANENQLIASSLMAKNADDGDPLPSWKKGKSTLSNRQQIINFVNAVNSKNIDSKDRIAVFDNDGTLWSERPYYFQVDYLNSSIPGKTKNMVKPDEEALVEILENKNGDLEVEEYRTQVLDFLRQPKIQYETVQPTDFTVPYLKLTYQPMIELVQYLQDNQFQVYICSGGGIDFVRSFSEDSYGIPRQNVIGSALIDRYDQVNRKVIHSGGTTPEIAGKSSNSSVTTVGGDDAYDKWDYEEGGYPTPPPATNTTIVNPFNDKEGKAIGIERYLGKKPIMAVGNSDGDFYMFDYTDSNDILGDTKPLIVLVNHDDGCNESWNGNVWNENCEYSYNNDVAQADPTNPNQDFCQDLEHCSLAVAKQRENWLVVSMKDDFTTIFNPFDN